MAGLTALSGCLAGISRRGAALRRENLAGNRINRRGLGIGERVDMTQKPVGMSARASSQIDQGGFSWEM